MTTVEIYGRSDDIIHICGDVNKQFYADYGESTKLVVLGYTIEIEYNTSDGIWTIDVVEEPESGSYDKYSAGDYPRYNSYTEVLILESSIDRTVQKT